LQLHESCDDRAEQKNSDNGSQDDPSDKQTTLGVVVPYG
jgi:hypothetical protein